MVKNIVFNNKISHIVEPTLVEKNDKDSFWDSDFIPTFSKDDEFLKYLDNEDK